MRQQQSRSGGVRQRIQRLGRREVPLGQALLCWADLNAPRLGAIIPARQLSLSTVADVAGRPVFRRYVASVGGRDGLVRLTQAKGYDLADVRRHPGGAWSPINPHADGHSARAAAAIERHGDSAQRDASGKSLAPEILYGWARPEPIPHPNNARLRVVTARRLGVSPEAVTPEMMADIWRMTTEAVKIDGRQFFLHSGDIIGPVVGEFVPVHPWDGSAPPEVPPTPDKDGTCVGSWVCRGESWTPVLPHDVQVFVRGSEVAGVAYRNDAARVLRDVGLYKQDDVAADPVAALEELRSFFDTQMSPADRLGLVEDLRRTLPVAAAIAARDLFAALMNPEGPLVATEEPVVYRVPVELLVRVSPGWQFDLRDPE